MRCEYKQLLFIYESGSILGLFELFACHFLLPLFLILHASSSKNFLRFYDKFPHQHKNTILSPRVTCHMFRYGLVILGPRVLRGQCGWRAGVILTEGPTKWKRQLPQHTHMMVAGKVDIRAGAGEGGGNIDLIVAVVEWIICILELSDGWWNHIAALMRNQ